MSASLGKRLNCCIASKRRDGPEADEHPLFDRLASVGDPDLGRSDGRVLPRIGIGIGCGNDDNPEPAAILATWRQLRKDNRFIQVRHEESAASMACAYAKLTRRLAVCLATSGPGGIHLLNGLYDAKLDGAPAITGLQYHDLVHTHTQQEVELDKLCMDVCVYNVRIMGPAHVEDVMELACRPALTCNGVALVTMPVDNKRAYRKGKRMRLFGMVLAGCLGATGAGAIELQCQPVRLVVPYAAGGATDVAARLVGQGMEAALKRPVVVETRTGASGNIGTAAVVNSPPDGCTLLVNAAVIATFPYSFSKLSYDPIKDLVPVGGIGITPTLLVTANANVSDLKGLVAWALQKPAGLSYSTAGYGLLQHLAVEEMTSRTGAKLEHVPYRGGGQATTDLVTGRVDFGSFAAGSVLPLVRQGQLRSVAVIQERRSGLAPDTPAAAEQGLPGLDAGVHFMLFAPAGIRDDLVAMLNSELNRVVGDPALKGRFGDIGFDPTPISADEARRIMQKTGTDWAPVIKRLNIRLD